MTDTDNTPPLLHLAFFKAVRSLEPSCAASAFCLDSRRVSRTHIYERPPLGGSGCNGGEGGEATAITLVLLPGNRLPDCRTVPMRDPGAVPTNDCKYPITPPPLPPQQDLLPHILVPGRPLSSRGVRRSTHDHNPQPSSDDLLGSVFAMMVDLKSS